jgi:hypothetical protein
MTRPGPAAVLWITSGRLGNDETIRPEQWSVENENHLPQLS